MLHFQSIAYTIGTHFVPALVNGDETGLNDEESAALDDFLTSLPPNGHWDFENETFFSRCDVTGERGDCWSAVYLYRS